MPNLDRAERRALLHSPAPTQRAIGLVLVGVLAGLDSDIRRSIDDRDSQDVAIAIASDLVRDLGFDISDLGTEPLCPGPTEAVSVSPEVEESILAPRTGWPSLTKMERLVALLIADGYTNQQAARQLGRSRHTIGTHLRSAFVKMQVQSRVQLTNALAGRDDLQPGQELAS